MAKEMLSAYAWLRLEISQLEETLAEMDSRARKTTASISGMPRGGFNIVDRMAETVARMIDIQAQINEKVLESLELLAQIERTLTFLPMREQVILRMRYVKCLEWESICKETDYSARQIHVIHSGALKSISQGVNLTESVAIVL